MVGELGPELTGEVRVERVDEVGYGECSSRYRLWLGLSYGAFPGVALYADRDPSPFPPPPPPLRKGGSMLISTPSPIPIVRGCSTGVPARLRRRATSFDSAT